MKAALDAQVTLFQVPRLRVRKQVATPVEPACSTSSRREKRYSWRERSMSTQPFDAVVSSLDAGLLLYCARG